MQVQIIEVHSDIGAGKHGTTQGVAMLSDYCQQRHPNAQRQAIIANHQATSLQYPHAKYVEHLLPFFAQQLVPELESCLKKSEENQCFPVIISGDHSNAIGNLAAFSNHYQHRRIGVVWIDAHADLHSVFTTPSGNIHGMPLAVALRLDNLDCKINDLSSDLVQKWQAMKDLSKHAGILPSDVFFLGLRSFEPPETHLIAKHQMFAYSAKGTPVPHKADVRQNLTVVLDDLVARLVDLDAVYISFDVDALDESLVPATGTPEPQGYEKAEVQQIFERLLPLPNVKLFELTEFNPTLDSDPDKHQTIFELLTDVLSLIAKRPS